METTQKKAASFKGIRSAGWVIVICFIIAVLIFHFVLGNPSNFMNNDPNNHPLPGNFLGTIYKGGFIVPVIQTLLLTVIALSIERYIAIGAAFGKGSLVKFVANIKAALAEGDMKKAQQICDSQRGSVANVVNATLKKYAEMENDTELSKDQKLLAIQKELEEATALELPMMEQNLPIIGTITTLGTLMGLLGTVIGMIRSFAALAAGGSADSMALSPISFPRLRMRSMEGEPFTTCSVLPARSSWLLMNSDESGTFSSLRCTSTCLFNTMGVVSSKESFSSLVARMP